MIRPNSNDGTQLAIEQIRTAANLLSHAASRIREINDGSYKHGQIPIAFNTDSCQELIHAITELDCRVTMLKEAASPIIIEPDRYPTLKAMREIQPESELCKRFLDFLENKYDMFSRCAPREEPYYTGSGDYINHETELAEFFSIDLNQAEEERQRLLNTLINTLKLQKDDNHEDL